MLRIPETISNVKVMLHNNGELEGVSTLLFILGKKQVLFACVRVCVLPVTSNDQPRHSYN